MSSGGANAGLERSRLESGRLGRKLGIVLFWLLLCYAIGMSARSIIPSLFWPALAPRPHAPALQQCAREIELLDQQLLSKSAQAVRGAGLAKLGHFLHAWDERYMALAGGCGPLEAARKDLQQLRTEVEALLRTYQGKSWKIQERIHRALSQSVAPPASE